ncbi:hypothetical protein A2Z22_01930 [Candidatus Woesebacteria bacterium RBG_16_34_12]|uniref:Uncharacterized protein n=1 Tax=Candidatus Woesebacteria bacterium RBG_16_34_12 TaxID=1802480 RepID=A0A1F7XCK8_9BACT|nr:MAG: hypothetical protein A2Z22_01930 [Candidatus Woesebacteria bacterium RBG_16_34_12]
MHLYIILLTNFDVLAGWTYNAFQVSSNLLFPFQLFHGTTEEKAHIESSKLEMFIKKRIHYLPF